MSNMDSSIIKVNSNGSVANKIQNNLEFKIITGELAPGEKFPSIRELAETYKIGTVTAQAIVTNLSKDEIITKKPGVGFFVMPYVKGKLVQKHTSECKKMLKRVIEYAVRFGLDPEAIVAEVFKEENIKG